MEANYLGYVVGGVRELVTLAMLKHIQDGTVLFPENPDTFARCKEKYQTGDYWKGYRVLLGGNSSSASSGLVVASNHDGYAHIFCGLFGLVVVS